MIKNKNIMVALVIVNEKFRQRKRKKIKNLLRQMWVTSKCIRGANIFYEKQKEAITTEIAVLFIRFDLL